MKIIFFVRSVPPYWSNRIDVDYIIKELIKKNNEVFIFDIKQRMLLNCNEERIKFFGEIFNFLDKTPFYLLTNFLVFTYFLIRYKKKFDITHILYVREEQLLLHRFIWAFSNKLFITIYGSDINERNFIKNNFRKLFFNADIITATNENILFKLQKYVKNFQLNGKLKVLMLPQIRFQKFANIIYNDKYKTKIKLGFDKYAKVIIVGTSAVEYEQHVEIINRLSKLPKLNLLFVFPLTYGAGNFNSYRENIKREIENKIVENKTKVLFEYMNEEDLAELRIASDIFINLRKNDQLVASMLESFLTYTEVITGSWLPYSNLKKLGVYFESVNSINEINSILLKVIKFSIVDRINILEKNKTIIQKEFSFENDLNNWIEIYK